MSDKKHIFIAEICFESETIKDEQEARDYLYKVLEFVCTQKMDGKQISGASIEDLYEIEN